MQNLTKKGEGKMWELSASISGELLVPAWENNSALQHSFQHKHAQRVLRAKLHAERKPWSRFLGQQRWPIGCGAGAEPTSGPFMGPDI